MSSTTSFLQVALLPIHALISNFHLGAHTGMPAISRYVNIHLRIFYKLHLDLTSTV